MKFFLINILIVISIPVFSQIDSQDYDFLEIDTWQLHDEYINYLNARFFNRIKGEIIIKEIFVPSWGHEFGSCLEKKGDKYYIHFSSAKRQLYYSKLRFLIRTRHKNVELDSIIALKIIDLFNTAFSRPSERENVVLDGIDYYFQLRKVDQEILSMKASNPGEGSKLEEISEILWYVFDSYKEHKIDTNISTKIENIKERFQ